MPDPIKVTLALARTTKNTYRSQADDADPAPVRTLYIMQDAFQGGAPKAITVTIETA